MWVPLGLWVWVNQGPGLVRSLRPDVAAGDVQDFFQEWASAKNRVAGLPVYLSQRISLEKHLGIRPDAYSRLYIEWNAHPPSAVLVAFPFVKLAYADAHLVWNLLSIVALAVALALIIRTLKPPHWAWGLALFVGLAPICGPLRHQLQQGQVNLLLLLLLTGAWICHRSGRDLASGTLVGIATAVKLFPGLLLLYLVLRRRWVAVASAAGSFAAMTLLTVLALGVEAYRDYVRVVLPAIAGFRSSWGNASLIGFWSRLFAPPSERVLPLIHSQALALLASGASVAVVVWLLARATRRARSTEELDHAFGLHIVAMLLLSPLTWTHGLLLLILPISVSFTGLSQQPTLRAGAAIAVTLLGLDLPTIWTAFIGHDWIARTVGPLHSLTVLAYPVCALLGLFLLGLRRLRTPG